MSMQRIARGPSLVMLAIALAGCTPSPSPAAPVVPATSTGPVSNAPAEAAPTAAPVQMAEAAEADAGAAPAEPAEPVTRVTTVSADGKPLASDRCQADMDCTLDSAPSCCGGCVVLQPVRGVSRAKAEREERKANAHCAVEDHDCSVDRCPHPPRGCKLQAVCEAGRCVAKLSGPC